MSEKKVNNTVQVGKINGTLTKRKDRDNQYYLRFSYKGKQPYLNTGLTDLKEAKVKAIEMIERHVKGVTEEAFSKSDALISNCVNEFIKTEYLHNTETGKTIRRRLGILQKALKTDKVSEITEEVCLKAFHEIEATGYKPKKDGPNKKYEPHYMSDLITSWKSCFAWMYLKKKIFTHPDILFVSISAPKESEFLKIKEILEDEDLEIILADMEPLDAEVVRLMRYSSMYAGDVFNLHFDHIVKNRKTGKYQLVKQREKAKSKKEKYRQPLNEKVKSIILPRLVGKKAGDRLFPFYVKPKEVTKEDTTKQADVFANLLSKKWGRRFRKLFPDRNPLKLTILRHVFITKALEAKIGIPTIKKWVGHSPKSMEIENTYDHYDDTSDEMDEMMAELEMRKLD